MTAGMQQYDAARRQPTQAIHHGIKCQAVSVGVVVRITARGETGPARNGVMIVPSRVTDPDFAVGIGAKEKIRADLKRPCTTQSLNGCHPALSNRRTVSTEHNAL